MKKFVEVVTELQEHSYKGEGGDTLWRNGQPTGSNRVMHRGLMLGGWNLKEQEQLSCTHPPMVLSHHLLNVMMKSPRRHYST